LGGLFKHPLRGRLGGPAGGGVWGRAGGTGRGRAARRKTGWEEAKEKIGVGEDRGEGPGSDPKFSGASKKGKFLKKSQRRS
jgi:hypothetical protein